jgi:hypothetical protein
MKKKIKINYENQLLIKLMLKDEFKKNYIRKEQKKFACINPR